MRFHVVLITALFASMSTALPVTESESFDANPVADFLESRANNPKVGDHVEITKGDNQGKIGDVTSRSGQWATVKTCDKKAVSVVAKDTKPTDKGCL